MTVVVRVLRVGLGALMLLVAIPLILAGGGLWLVSQHRQDGAFTAHLEPTRTDGRAIVVTDVDGLLRRDAPFARGGQTTLSVAGRSGAGKLFLGLARQSDVQRYLDGAAYATVTRVRLARGPLPVDITPAATAALQPATLARPAGEDFWIRAGDEVLAWSPSSVRGQHLAVVVMNADGSAGVDVALTARLAPAWVSATAGGLMIGGTALFLLGLLSAAWPTRRQRVTGVPAEATEPDDAPSTEDTPTTPVPPRPRAEEVVPDGTEVIEGEIEVRPQITKEPQNAVVAPDGPPPALPPVNLRLTWPALPGTRQKEDFRG
jgi:hypothetical protein